jgi:prepilin-type N-terminal cleavage/methylation domain-containing protein
VIVIRGWCIGFSHHPLPPGGEGRGEGKRPAESPRCSTARPSTDAFTFIELLIVTVILGIVTAVLVACVAGGIRVWESARRFDTVENEAMLGLASVQKDVMNAFAFYAAPFRGGPRQMRFASLVETPAESGETETRIATVDYSMDVGAGRLTRLARVFPEEEAVTRHGESIVENLDDARLWYAAASDNRKAPGAAWADVWEDPTNLPQRVRVDLTFEDGGQQRMFSRTFIIPVAGVESGGQQGVR